MKINWFPGHMTKALKEIKYLLNNIDVVVYVLDSRAPISSINPSLDKLSQNKPVLYVFNKTDLADNDRVKTLAQNFKGEGRDYCLLNSTMSGSGRVIKQKINALARQKIEKFKAKGIRTLVRAIIVGVPNSGKSTLVNNLCGKAKTLTGNRPGVTKAVQWVNIGDNIELCDTPGTLYPNLENQQVALKLLCVGSIKDEIIADTCEVASGLIDMIKEKYPPLLPARYGDDLTLEGIAKRRGYILSKDEYDLQRTATAIIDDFRKGKIGRITLD